MEVLQAVADSNDAKLLGKVENALGIIRRTLEIYGTGGVAFSFNGGKDSTVLLHLIRAAVAQRGALHTAINAGHGLGGVVTFFFHNDADFPEITDFCHAVNKRYSLHMETLQGDFKLGIEELLMRTPIKAIILGTRRGDPNAASQETFCPSTAGWPAFMRVNPILDWTYHDVWSFLRAASVPYCALYDRGYTSVGSVGNTQPNEALRKEDGSYAPADMLPDARLERAGRFSGDTTLQRKASLLGLDTPTAGLVIIGDEILTAKVEDANMRFLCAELRALGWRVDRAVFVRDSVEIIAAEVRALSEAHDVVLTAGGLGPTLDDVTMRAVAEAFGQRLERHAELQARIRAFFGANTTEAHLKMSEAPSGCEVTLIDYTADDGRASPFPIVRCRNVYVLPGIPALLQKKWAAVQEHLTQGGAQPRLPFHSVVLRLRLRDETVVAAALEEVAAQGDGEVAVGSYPVSSQSDGCEVVLSLESKDEGLLEAARERLVALLPPGVVASEHRDADDALNSPVDRPTLGPA